LILKLNRYTASTTTGYIALQLAKLCGLKVICIADIARHGAKLHAAGADILVDRHDTDRAVEIIRGVTNGRLLFGLDIVGRETATILQRTLFTSEHDGPQAHLLGLTGLPKEKDPRIKSHTVPIKIFHSSAAVGEALVTWLERLLETKVLSPPDVIVKSEGGLGGINDALEVLKSGAASGKRIVVDLGRDD
jgi:NADPH:quinone reductase-like Zn-dependent oxidoreductase